MSSPNGKTNDMYEDIREGTSDALVIVLLFFFDIRILITPLVSSNSSYGDVTVSQEWKDMHCLND
jgi:hypothetical protein